MFCSITLTFLREKSKNAPTKSSLRARHDRVPHSTACIRVGKLLGVGSDAPEHTRCAGGSSLVRRRYRPDLKRADLWDTRKNALINDPFKPCCAESSGSLLATPPAAMSTNPRPTEQLGQSEHACTPTTSTCANTCVCSMQSLRERTPSLCACIRFYALSPRRETRRAERTTTLWPLGDRPC